MDAKEETQVQKAEEITAETSKRKLAEDNGSITDAPEDKDASNGSAKKYQRTCRNERKRGLYKIRAACKDDPLAAKGDELASECAVTPRGVSCRSAKAHVDAEGVTFTEIAPQGSTTSSAFAIKLEKRDVYINIYDFCAEIKLEQVLWKKSCKNFRNNQARLEAWRRVAAKLDPVFDKIQEWKPELQQDIAKQLYDKYRHLRDHILRVKRNKLSGRYYLWDHLEFVLEREESLCSTTEQNEQSPEESYFAESLHSHCDGSAHEEGSVPEELISVEEDSAPPPCSDESQPVQHEICEFHIATISTLLEDMDIDQMLFAIDVMSEIVREQSSIQLFRFSKECIINIGAEACERAAISLKAATVMKTSFIKILRATADMWCKRKPISNATEKLWLCCYVCRLGTSHLLNNGTTYFPKEEKYHIEEY